MGFQSVVFDVHAALTPKAALVGGNYAATRELFLRGISACFFAAFASFLLQVPGLYGPQGLQPVDNPGQFDNICLRGLLFSCLGLCGFGNVFVMYWLTSSYSFIVEAAPPPFYNFQWDILLVEAGYMAALLAPLVHSSLEPRPSSAALWMLRFILFKLMLMSGVVKFTSYDESWFNLTAIWYHFATQCIPTPGAWYFHNLPMWLEKAFCAIMFMIEIPAAFLILVPVREVQLLAAFFQISLQLVIIITGNYTFFNYLTMLLAFTLIDRSMIPSCCAAANADAEPQDGNEETVPLLQNSNDSAPPAAAERRTSAFSSLVPMAGWICCFTCLVWTLYHAKDYGFNFDLKMHTSTEELQNWTSTVVPAALIFMSIIIPVFTLMDIYSVAFVDRALLSEGVESVRQEQATGRCKFLPVYLTSLVAIALLVFRGMACFRMLSLMPGPLSEISPSLRSASTRVSLWEASAGSSNGDVRMPLGLPHYGPFGYGLFRSMTGIGEDGSVARPELAFEVQDGTGDWHELQFRYKPGDVNRRPPIIAPYQPRLDWQMWFQALSPYSNSWFVSLREKIQTGSPAVLRLLDPSSLPDTEVNALRVRSYVYKFTSYGQSGWWERQDVGDGAGVREEPYRMTPVNLAQQCRKEPFDWRRMAVWGYILLLALLYLVPQWLGADWHKVLEYRLSTTQEKAE